MKCPVCGTPDLLMTERQGVEIDYCPNCRGVWLDRGELDKLIERTDGVPASAQAAQGGAQHGYGRGGYDARDARRSDDAHDKREGRHDRGDREYRDSHNRHHGHDDRRRYHDRPRKKKSLFDMFDFG